MEISLWAAIVMQIVFVSMLVGLIVCRAQLKRSTNRIHALTEVNGSLMKELGREKAITYALKRD